MSTKLIKLGIVLFASYAICGAMRAADYNQAPIVPKIDVQIESDLKVLAHGFVAAFAELPAGAKWIWIRAGDDTIVLGSVASVRAYGGVLVIHIDSGPTHLVSAGDVVQITNERPSQTKK